MARGTAKTPEKPVRFSPGVPPPPDDLDEVARAVYEFVANEAEINFQQVDGETLAKYAQAVSDKNRLTKLVRQQGESLVSDKGNLYPNPNNNAKQMAINNMTSAANDLLLTPKSRQRSVSKAAKKADPLANFV